MGKGFLTLLKEQNRESGQTLVEYILLIFVVLLVLSGIMKKVEEYLISNPNSFQNLYLKQYNNTFNTGSAEMKYKYFFVRR